MDKFDALVDALLPQYMSSLAFMERLLVAAHEPGSSLERYESIPGTTKYADQTEVAADGLVYFIANKDALADEFVSELLTLHPEGAGDFKTFFEVISQEWFDGKRLRQNGRSRGLKRSILDYLVSKFETPWRHFVHGPEDPTDTAPLISRESLEAILKVNGWMLVRHIEEWKLSHPNHRSISNDDVFLRRGLVLDKPFDTAARYTEYDFINSYSIAFSAPERFSKAKAGVPAIVNGELALFEDRVLFFSPFIPNMDVGQLEFGIIPSRKPLPLHYQGSHGDILEYILDPAPFQRG